jgi:hypothetical protein
MNDHDQTQPDDLLERSIAALRDEAVSRDPSPQAVAGTLAALRKAQNPSFFQRVVAMTLTQKIAAAAALTIGGAVVYFLATLFGGFSSISYAEVADQIREVRTMVCNITVTPANSGTAVTMRMMFMSPDKTRMEMPGGMAMIMDQKDKRSLVLDENHKTATLTDIKTTGGPSARSGGGDDDAVQHFLDLAKADGTPEGRRQIGDVNAMGFRVQDQGQSALVFADPKTGRPLEIDYEEITGVKKMVMDDFSFDQTLDPVLFSMTPLRCPVP